jgi:hypothetical protein
VIALIEAVLDEAIPVREGGLDPVRGGMGEVVSVEEISVAAARARALERLVAGVEEETVTPVKSTVRSSPRM